MRFTSSRETPKILDIFSAQAEPPGAHKLVATPSVTTASAYASQPAKPHPPQLAPGKQSLTKGILSSTSTLNLSLAYQVINQIEVQDRQGLVQDIKLLLIPLRPPYIRPLNLEERIAIRPAVTSAIGNPWNTSGMLSVFLPYVL